VIAAPHHDSWHDDRIKEECGVVGLSTPGHPAARSAFFALFALQHRGQESAGIATIDQGSVRVKKGLGLIQSVFDDHDFENLPGTMAVGHTRYSTTGANTRRNAQPIYCQTVMGDMAVGHNGNLINAEELKAELEAEGEVFDTTADSEVIAKLLQRYMTLGPENAIAATMKKIKGAYSVVVLTPKAILGFRDPNGIRPLIAGRIFEDGFMIASESCAFAPFDGVVEQELNPGACVIIDREGMRFAQCVPPDRAAMCLFEYIYFARPDSEMNGTLLYDARMEMGKHLARERPCPEAEMVIPVPDSGIPAAQGYAQASGLDFREGMMKSRYIHRTFINPDERMRSVGVRMKLSPMRKRLHDKKVVLVDDSIVRGTTTGEIVKLLKDAGAKEVHVRITAPPITWPCFYGIDMASKDKLIAANMSVEQIQKKIGADSLGYLSLEGVFEAISQEGNPYCHACFSGQYPIPVDRQLRKDAFEKLEALPQAR
jgi:amidophosphoribosyltransferase